MDKVTIQIDAKWVKIAHSPLYWVVTALQGVSITFAPMFLYWAGRGWFPEGEKWIAVTACFGTIFLVPLFFFRLGGAVIGELRKLPPPRSS
jgi:hypothetical protein